MKFLIFINFFHQLSHDGDYDWKLQYFTVNMFKVILNVVINQEKLRTQY